MSTDSLLLEQRRILQEAAVNESVPTDHLLGKHAADAPRSAKAAYAAYLSSVSSAMHTDIGGRELQGIASDVFSSLQRDGFSAGPPALSQLLGTKVNEAEFRQVQQAHVALTAARDSLNLPDAAQPAPDSPVSPWKPRYFTPTTDKLPFNATAVLSKLCAPPDLSEPATSATPDGPTPAALAKAYAQQLQSAAQEMPSTFQLVAPDPPKQEAAAAASLHGELDRARGKMSLTALQQTVCKITGQPPPSRGGDETVLLLIVQTLLQTADPDAAAGQLLEVLGFEHMDLISDIVNKREVRSGPPPQLCMHGAHAWCQARYGWPGPDPLSALPAARANCRRGMAWPLAAPKGRGSRRFDDDGAAAAWLVPVSRSMPGYSEPGYSEPGYREYRQAGCFADCPGQLERRSRHAAERGRAAGLGQPHGAVPSQHRVPKGDSEDGTQGEQAKERPPGQQGHQGR